MKPIKSLLALLTLPLMMSCYSDVLTQQKPAGPETANAEESVRTYRIPYSATVFDGDRNDSNAVTRATLTADKHYVYSAGDMLYVQGTGENASKIYGALELTSADIGKSSGITFEGELTVAEGFTPTDDTPLEAVLVGADAELFTFNTQGTRILSTAYPKANAIVPTLAEAVERYSYMTATSTYGEKQYNLTQNSCFVNFTVTMDDGTAAGTNLDAYVWTDADALLTDVRNGQVTTVDDGGAVKAKFTVAFPGGTTLDGAVVGLDPRAAISFGGTTTLAANKIYNVNKTFSRTAGSVSYAVTSITKCHPDYVFGNMLTLEGDGTVTFSSDAPDVATVDATTGEVTIVGVGTATITATVADGINYTYAGNNTANYTVTVKDPVALADVTAAHVGWVIGSDGRAYVTKTGASASSTELVTVTPVAMIGYVGAAGSVDASSDTYRGLAIALEDYADGLTTSITWADATGTCTPARFNTFESAKTALNGITYTAGLASYTCRNDDPSLDEPDLHVHDAASAAHNYSVAGFTPSDHACSPWFLPSFGQWFKVLGGCGVATSQWNNMGYCPDSEGGETNRADNYTAMQTLMEAVGTSFSSGYWTCTEYSFRNVYYVGFNSTTGIEMTIKGKSSSYNVRPFFAF